jgi:hypothetical protein
VAREAAVRRRWSNCTEPYPEFRLAMTEADEASFDSDSCRPPEEARRLALPAVDPALEDIPGPPHCITASAGPMSPATTERLCVPTRAHGLEG